MCALYSTPVVLNARCTQRPLYSTRNRSVQQLVFHMPDAWIQCPATSAGTLNTPAMTDTLPPGVTFVGAGGSGWNCTQTSGVVTCTRSALAPGAAPDIVITATAPLTDSVITNTATIGSDLSDNILANNSG
jgi:hypothetical protein